jgi:hypothetical protein
MMSPLRGLGYDDVAPMGLGYDDVAPMGLGYDDVAPMALPSFQSRFINPNSIPE